MFGVNHTSQLTEGDNVCQGQRQAERIIKRAFNRPFWCYLYTDGKNEWKRKGWREKVEKIKMCHKQCILYDTGTLEEYN